MPLAGALVALPPDDGRPLYRRLLDQLRSDLDSGRLRPGDLIPPELEIARSHGISRHTVRQAIVELAREGLLRRERGRGTFVSPPPIVRTLGSFYSFAHEMKGRGVEFHTRVLHREVRPATRPGRGPARSAARRAGRRDGAVAAGRGRPGQPGVLDHVAGALPEPADRRRDQALALRHHGLAHGVAVTLGREELRPVVLDERQADLLDVAPGSPAFHVERETLAGSEPVEWRRSLVRGDRYLFRVELPVRG